MLVICADSHLDHALTLEQVRWILKQLRDVSGFGIHELEMPPELGTLPCALVGPVMGDAPVGDADVRMRRRANRDYPSRVLAENGNLRPTSKVTVVCGPHLDFEAVLYTAYGGPAAPRECHDPSLPESEKEAAASFWAEHALVLVA